MQRKCRARNGRARNESDFAVGELSLFNLLFQNEVMSGLFAPINFFFEYLSEINCLAPVQKKLILPVQKNSLVPSAIFISKDFEALLICLRDTTNERLQSIFFFANKTHLYYSDW